MTYYPHHKENRKTAFKIPEILNEQELEALLDQPNRNCPTGLRNYAMMKIMADLGLRASELLSLDMRDIDWTSGKLAVRQGKGKKDRILWLSMDDLELLQSWREIKPQSDYLFCTLKGGKVSDRYLRDMVKRLANKAGIDKDVHPHTLRHTFATDLYRETKNLRLVQKALGHSSLAATQIYTHIVDAELEAALKGFRSKSTKGAA
jgi:integrase/recombinase XerD